MLLLAAKPLTSDQRQYLVSNALLTLALSVKCAAGFQYKPRSKVPYAGVAYCSGEDSAIREGLFAAFHTQSARAPHVASS